MEKKLISLQLPIKLTFTLALFIFAIIFPLLIFAQNTDIDLLKHLNQNRSRHLDPIFIGITHTAGPLAFGLPLVLLGIGLAKRKRLLKRKALFIITSVLLAVIVTSSLKYSINRPRPFETYTFIEKVTSGGSPSFPSGHTTDAFVLATALSLAFPRKSITIISFLWALIIAYSRMGLGVHYPADVAIGALVGISAAFIIYFIMTRKRWLPE
ncbi:MAG: hypothetical protein CVT92_11870 [Bacteroidetes bacterium HGW-Bacteroidetes-1]|jgi:undecaprenyl-diphosphatase|nr:MAG: hypothetical protein CVT92_11870 [Bacteroidetes bacterium HGW-Bacteroidetes-1]